MRADALRIALLLVLLAPSLRADDGDETVADLEFLEYLGSLVRDDAGWLDPSDLRGPAETERDRVVVRESSVEPDVRSARDAELE